MQDLPELGSKHMTDIGDGCTSACLTKFPFISIVGNLWLRHSSHVCHVLEAWGAPAGPVRAAQAGLARPSCPVHPRLARWAHRLAPNCIMHPHWMYKRPWHLARPPQRLPWPQSAIVCDEHTDKQTDGGSRRSPCHALLLFLSSLLFSLLKSRSWYFRNLKSPTS